jgi:hypothetical protein
MSGRSKNKTEGVDHGKKWRHQQTCACLFFATRSYFFAPTTGGSPVALCITDYTPLKEKTNLEQMNHYKENRELRLKIPAE